MYFLATPEFANDRAQAGLAASRPTSACRSGERRRAPMQKTALDDAAGSGDHVPLRRLRPDAGAVGSDAEWKQFTAWITGQDDATTLANIDAAWPAS